MQDDHQILQSILTLPLAVAGVGMLLLNSLTSTYSAQLIVTEVFMQTHCPLAVHLELQPVNHTEQTSRGT